MGVDISWPFAPTLGQLGYLIVIVDYFTKWIEVEALANITATHKFFKRNVLARFRVPQAVVIDNEMQLKEKRLKILLEELNMRQNYASVEHPQTNG